MARESGIKVWRYRNNVWTYHHRGRSDLDETLDPKKVTYPRRSTVLQQDDWLIQRAETEARGQKTTSIDREDVIAVIPNRYIPSDGEIWYWDGKHLNRIYTRRASPDSSSANRAEVAAAIDADPDDRLIIVSRGDLKPMVYDKNTWEWNEVALEAIEGQIKLGPSASKDSLDDDELLLAALSRRLALRKKDVEEAARLAEAGDNEGAAKIVRDVVVETISGAQPNVVQGHNVLHSVPGILDKIEQLDAVCKQAVSSQQAAADSRATLTGGFGQGVGLVDSSWQALGSCVTFFSDVMRTFRMGQKTSEERVAKYGHNAEGRQALTLGTSLTKGVTTSWSAVDAIGKVAAFSSNLPSPLTPAVGSITGLITTVRSSVQADKSRRRMNKLNKILSDNKGKTLDETVQKLLAFGMRKAKRKLGFKSAEATAGAFSAVGGGILLVGAIVAGANLWNPIGWGISIAVFVAGAGLLTYKIVRRLSSEGRAKKRGFSTSEFPRKLLETYLHHFNKDAYSRETVVIDSVIRAYGVNPLEVLTNAGAVGLAFTTIQRHLK